MIICNLLRLHDPSRRRTTVCLLLFGAALALGAPPARPASGELSYGSPGGQAPPCQAIGAGGPPQPAQATSITTIAQAYYCLFSHYVDATALDDRVLLTGAFAGFSHDLVRRGLDQPNAVLPALSGDSQTDWSAFAATYQQLSGQLPADSTLLQELASAAIVGMAASLHNDHTGWRRAGSPPSTAAYGLGITLSIRNPSDVQPATNPPLFITSVAPGSPADRSEIRPGDVIGKVNGIPPAVNGQFDLGVFAWLQPFYPQNEEVEVVFTRPSTGHTRRVELAPGNYAPPPQVAARVLAGDIAYVKLTSFGPNSSSAVLSAVSNLRLGHELGGVILDNRGNRGGIAAEVGKLLGAFVHGAVWSYSVDGTGRVTPSYTDSSVPLLGRPLVVLIDQDCASACDAFSAAVKDLHLGRLVGTRTAGNVAGIANGYWLNDGSVLVMPSSYGLGVNGEIIDGIGVPPDDNAPVTAQALSSGHDPAIAQALALLGAAQ